MNESNKLLKQQYLDTAKFIVQLIEDVGDRLKFQQLVTIAGSAYNPISKIYYKGMNRWMLMHAVYCRASKINNLWVTEKQAISKGWCLKPGAIPIYLGKYIPISKEKKIDVLEESACDRRGIEDGYRLARIPFTVYNIADFSGVPDYLLRNKGLSVSTEECALVQRVTALSPCRVLTSWSHTPSYNPLVDCINMPNIKVCCSVNGYCLSLLHEIVHSTGHLSRLHREITNEFGSLEYAKEELVAELGSVLLAQRLHMSVNQNDYMNTAAYIKSWCEPLHDDYTQVFKALNACEDAVQFILGEEREIVYGKCG